MKCRKNLRTLFAEYNSASAADNPNTDLMKIKNAVLALKNSALHPSQLISRADVAADIANDISMGMLGPGSTLISRYDELGNRRDEPLVATVTLDAPMNAGRSGLYRREAAPCGFC